MLATFWLSSHISPVVGRSRHPIRFTSVDFPEPDGPMIDTHSPGATVREKSSSARMLPPFSSALAGYRRLTLMSLITLLSLQDDSWLHATQERHRHDGGKQRNRNASGEHNGQHA